MSKVHQSSASHPLEAQRAELLAKIARYFAWQEEPVMVPCERCEGKGYRGDDFCASCGGAGGEPTEPGRLSPDDLLREAANLLSALSRVEDTRRQTEK